MTITVVSCSTSDKSVDKVSPEQVINYELIEDFYPINSYLDSIFKIREFITVQRIQVSEGSDTLTILLKQLSGWDDAGDFIKIVILDKDSNVIFDITNTSGWVKFGNNYFLPDSVISKNLIPTDMALLINNITGKQLFCFGWVYASQPGLMTIIDLFPEPRIIFNRNFELTSIDDTNEYIVLKGGTSLSNTKQINTKIMVIE